MHTNWLIAAALFCGGALAAENADAFLFTSFRGNGEDGLHLAWSDDGCTWTPLKKDQSFLKPAVGGKLMRDPCIVAGPDGTFHMVWTTGWWEQGFGYANSKDLIAWSEQKYVPINEGSKAKNTWAPELFYDAKKAQFLIFWSATIPGAFPETEKAGDHNHRIYCTTTKDFAAFSPVTLLYNPGFNCIDGTLQEIGGKFVLFFKDERPGKKTLRIATADAAEGPYGAPSEPFTGDWVEGPSAMQIKGEWFVYYDHYTKPHYYGAAKSADLKKWDDVSKQMKFPAGHRHGTVLRVTREALEKLKGQ
jgi:hypothetical protein